MSEMSRYLGTKKKPTYLVGPLERSWILASTRSGRRTDVLHPSEITKSTWCIRESWFLLRGASQEEETYNFRTLNIFQTGHDIHRKWQGWAEGADWLVGAWWCRTHDETWWGKRSDDHQDCPFVVYEEVPAVNNEFRISGHADGWLSGVPDRDDWLWEIKSVGTGTLRMEPGMLHPEGLEYSFSLLNRPLKMHVRQVMLYRWLLQSMFDQGHIEDPPPERALITYECKANQDVKEFVVKYHEDYVAETLSRVQDLWDSGSTPPPCSGGPKCGCGRYS